MLYHERLRVNHVPNAVLARCGNTLCQAMCSTQWINVTSTCRHALRLLNGNCFLSRSVSFAILYRHTYARWFVIFYSSGHELQAHKTIFLWKSLSCWPIQIVIGHIFQFENEVGSPDQTRFVKIHDVETMNPSGPSATLKGELCDQSEIKKWKTR